MLALESVPIVRWVAVTERFRKHRFLFFDLSHVGIACRVVSSGMSFLLLDRAVVDLVLERVGFYVRALDSCVIKGCSTLELVADGCEAIVDAIK